MYHPSLEYALVASVAAAATFLLTPLARRVAIGWGAVAKPRDRDVHAVSTPRMGGVALLGGLAAAGAADVAGTAEPAVAGRAK